MANETTSFISEEHIKNTKYKKKVRTIILMLDICAIDFLDERFYNCSSFGLFVIVDFLSEIEEFPFCGIVRLKKPSCNQKYVS